MKRHEGDETNNNWVLFGSEGDCGKGMKLPIFYCTGKTPLVLNDSSM